VATLERWLPVAYWEDLYDVSNLGRVWSRRSKIVLSPRQSRYLSVRLSGGDYSPTRTIHSLVTEAFHGPRPPGQVARHRNRQTHDNRDVNLHWGTPAQNVADAIAHGTHGRLRLTHCPREHLLIVPNLSVAHLSYGQRTCLACKRAISAIDKAARRGLVLNLQIESDWRYQSIMDEVA
jgi:hypothetical protein